MTLKRCRYCGVEHELTDIYWYFKKDGQQPACKKRERDRYQLSSKVYPIYNSERYKKWYSENKDFVKAKNKKNINRNAKRLNAKKHSDNLTTSYCVKSLAFKFKIPCSIIREYPDVIEYYRVHIELMRLCNAPKNLQQINKL